MVKNILVLHHDYPEFLCTNYTYLTNRIPTFTPQLRNLILSARPAALMDLPDPMTPGLKVERLEEMSKSPELAVDFDAVLQSESLTEVIDSALKKGGDMVTDIETIKSALSDEVENSLIAPLKNIEILSALPPYIAVQALANGSRFDPSSPATTFLVKLTLSLEPMDRNYFINALIDQIRYPNTHTDFYCKFVLHIWGSNDSSTEAQRELREQLSRVILERVYVARPHPWGTVVLSQELVSNATYGFWDNLEGESMWHRLQEVMKQAGGMH
jgi:CCR4-NOT transcription complex subunit 1